MGIGRDKLPMPLLYFSVNCMGLPLYFLLFPFGWAALCAVMSENVYLSGRQ